MRSSRSDAFKITVRGDDVQLFDTRSDEVYCLPTECLRIIVLKSYSRFEYGADQLKTLMSSYEMQIVQKGLQPSHQTCKNHRDDILGSESPS